MLFDEYNLNSPYDEIHNQVYDDFIVILNKIDPNLKFQKYILSGGYLIHKFIYYDKEYNYNKDIDLFFESRDDFDSIDAILRQHVLEDQSNIYITENAHTYSICVNPELILKIQLIKSYFGNNEFILNEFDLHNCQIALNQDGILTINKNFNQLYNQKRISINEKKVIYNFNKIGKDYLFSISRRILKYMNKYDLTVINNYDLIKYIEEEYKEALESNFISEFIIVDSSGIIGSNSDPINRFWICITRSSYEFYKNYMNVEQDWPHTYSLIQEQNNLQL